MEIKEVGVASAAKVAAAFYSLPGLFMGAVFALIGATIPPGKLAEAAADMPSWAAPSFRFLFEYGPFVLPAAMVGIGLLTGLAGAAVYNWVASRWSGLLTTAVQSGAQLQIQRIDPTSAARMVVAWTLAYVLAIAAISLILAPFASRVLSSDEWQAVMDEAMKSGAMPSMPLMALLWIVQFIASVAGYVVAVFAYNFWAEQWGGLRVAVDPADGVVAGGKRRLASVGVVSFAWSSMVVTVVAGVAPLPVSLLGQVATMGWAGLLGMVAGLFSLVFLIPMLAILGWVFGALAALLYNLLAAVGAALEIVVAPSPAPMAPVAPTGPRLEPGA